MITVSHKKSLAFEILRPSVRHAAYLALGAMLLRSFVTILGIIAAVGSPIVAAALMILVAGLLRCAAPRDKLITSALWPGFACAKLILIGLRSNIFEP